MIRVPNTIVAPSTLTITFKTPTFGVDLSEVTGVALNVVRRDGSTATWNMSGVSTTSAELVYQYAFTDGSEFTGTGVYYLAPVLAVPGGSIPAQAIAMYVSTQAFETPLLEAESLVAMTVPQSSGWVAVSSGTTAARPSAVPSIGFQYFDTTLGIPIFWNGSVWKSAAGATV